MPPTSINVLIVDDSVIFRKAVETALQGEKDINVIGTARNGLKALEFIRDNPVKPDLVTLDIEMPEMNGLETLDALGEMVKKGEIKEMPGVIVLSALSKKGADITITALDKGAFDFVTKPSADNQAESAETLKRQLKTKIITWDTSKKHRPKPTAAVAAAAAAATAQASPIRKSAKGIEAIVIGVSTGGPRALNDMMPLLCDKVDIPILIVQHMPPTFTKSLAEQLQSRCGRKYLINEGAEGDLVDNRKVFVAPGGKHMLLRKLGATMQVTMNDQPPENGCKPAVDVLFRSAASCYGGNVLAIILTGMGSDGVKGMGMLKRMGAVTIAQDEKTSVVWGMPGSAVGAGVADHVLPLMDIPEACFNIIYGKK